ncbi:MAG: TIGR01440 family protein [Candidatus Carbobacillus sp.]|nr:TIGR01440 family protein [Candidatus Carbobacillus sp.]
MSLLPTEDGRLTKAEIKHVWLALETLDQKFPFSSDHLLVIGVSTSEIMGKPIGTDSSLTIASDLFQVFETWGRARGVHLAFQCCEHLNRALVTTAEAWKKFHLERVTVRPIPKAGGAMATIAYERLPDALCVETVFADAGIDIGDTLIGMHLKRVAVPVRPPERRIGAAQITMAYTRPKLIGGPRAEYPERW